MAFIGVRFSSGFLRGGEFSAEYLHMVISTAVLSASKKIFLPGQPFLMTKF
jgi:hypothetical protein